MKKALLLTGGGDCPGLNAVIRGFCKRAQSEKDWKVFGSIEAFVGVLKEPQEIIELTPEVTGGIHVKGGTILGTTNKGNPIHYPTVHADGSVTYEDRSQHLVDLLNTLEFDAIINIGGDGSQRISKAFFDKGMPMIGVPKTIDNDLSATDFTFGFQTAVQVASDCFDRLVTTAESHCRTMIMEVMGRDAGWIALHAAISGGAEVCIIPEIPYDVDKIAERINQRYHSGRGFVNIVIAEGAKPKEGTVTGSENDKGSEHLRLGGVAFRLSHELKKAGCQSEIRETVLGHIQRGGTPTAFDRVLATMFGVHAFELAKEKQFGRMVSFRNNQVISVPLEEATREMNLVKVNSQMVRAAKGIGISFGD